MLQPVIPFGKADRVGEKELRNVPSVAVGDIGIQFGGNMEHDGGIGRVGIVPVTDPVGRAVVYLHISHPQCRADTELGIEKIRTGIGVLQSGVNDFDRLSFTGAQLVERENLVFPRIMQQLFHVN